MQVAQRSFFADLPIHKDLHITIISQNFNALKEVDKKTNALIGSCFKDANDEILQTFPQFKILQNGNEGNSSSLKTFMRLVNNLHDIAGTYDTKAPKGLSFEDRLKWEYNNYPTLIMNIKSNPLPADLTKVYEEMLLDLKQSNASEQNIANAQKIIYLCQSFFLHKTMFLGLRKFWERAQEGTKFNLKDNDIPLLIGYGQDDISLVESSHYFLAYLYLAAKRQNKLQGFFSSFTTADTVCFQSYMSNVQNWMMKELDLNVSK